MFSRVELRALPLFSGLNDANLDFSIRHSADIRLLKGEYELHEGETFGELPLILNAPLAVSFRAVQDARAMRLEARDFQVVAAGAGEGSMAIAFVHQYRAAVTTEPV